MSSVASVYVAKQADLPEIAAAGLEGLHELAREVQDAGIDALAMLHEQISALPDDSVLIVHVG